MAKSGLKKVTKLRKYINGRPTDEVKDNEVNTAGYIPDVLSKEECPVGCDAIVEGNVIVRGTTTTTTTTTIAVTPTPNLAQEFNISAPKSVGATESSTVQYTDEYGQTQEVFVNPASNQCFEFTIKNDGDPLGDDSYTYAKCGGSNVSGSVPFGDQITVCAESFSHQGSELTVVNTQVPCATVISKTKPVKSSGDSIVVQPVGNVFEATTTTTTKAPVVSTDYTIDTSGATESTVFTIQQPGSSTTQEVEIPRERVVKITSDVQPTIISGDQTPTITNEGSVTPQADTYTLTNNDYYNSTTLEYRPYLGVTDEILLSPRETIEVTSQDTPVVTGAVTNVNIVAAGTPTQEVDPATIQQRICNQHVLTNDSDFAATFEYRDCDLINQEVTLDPREQTSVAAVSAPTLSAGSSGNVGSSFNVDTIDKNYGTTGSAATVSPTTSTTTTSTTTTTTTISPDSLTETSIVSVQTAFCNDPVFLTKPEGVSWYPKTVKLKVGTKTGDFKFISYDAGVGTHYYKVYEGSTLLLDKSIVNDIYMGNFERKMLQALTDNGMSVTEAIEYANGSKRVVPQRLPAGTKNPFDHPFKTEFTLTKTTFEEFITVEIYKPKLESSTWAQFEIECIQ
jgi:hypothetical protein